MPFRHIMAGARAQALAYMALLLLVALMVLTVIAPGIASAQISGPNRFATYRLWAVNDATAAQTFATTSYADLAGSPLTTFLPVRDPNTVGAPGQPTIIDFIHVSFSMDVSKATATTGTCGVFANGALVTKTARTVSVGAGQVSMNGDFYIPNTTTGVQTIKLQCKSGDTNVFTVNNAHEIIEEIW